MSMPLWFEISIPIAIYHRYQYEMLDYGSNTARDIHFGSQVVYAVEKTVKRSVFSLKSSVDMIKIYQGKF